MIYFPFQQIDVFISEEQKNKNNYIASFNHFINVSVNVVTIFRKII